MQRWKNKANDMRLVVMTVLTIDVFILQVDLFRLHFVSAFYTNISTHSLTKKRKKKNNNTVHRVKS